MCHAAGMSARWTQDQLEEQAAKFAPERIRRTLAFAGLFQITHEMIKSSVLDQVKGFYGHVRVRGVDHWIGGEEQYKIQVLTKAPGKPFAASLAWLIEMDAITQGQADRLTGIYEYRHDLTHSLVKYIVDLDYEPDYAIFDDALSILRDLSRFWTQIEIDIGSFEDHPSVEVDDVVPLNIMVLDLCIQAHFEDVGINDPGEDIPAATEPAHDQQKGSLRPGAASQQIVPSSDAPRP